MDERFAFIPELWFDIQEERVAPPPATLGFTELAPLGAGPAAPISAPLELFPGPGEPGIDLFEDFRPEELPAAPFFPGYVAAGPDGGPLYLPAPVEELEPAGPVDFALSTYAGLPVSTSFSIKECSCGATCACGGK